MFYYIIDRKGRTANQRNGFEIECYLMKGECKSVIGLNLSANVYTVYVYVCDTILTVSCAWRIYNYVTILMIIYVVLIVIEVFMISGIITLTHSSSLRPRGLLRPDPESSRSSLLEFIAIS